MLLNGGDMDPFGTRIRDARLARGMSLQTCCRGITSARELSLIEHGLAEVSTTIRAQLAARLGVDRDARSDLHYAIGARIEAAIRRGDHRAVSQELTELTELAEQRPVYLAFPVERQGDLAGAARILAQEALDESALWRFRRLLALCRTLRDSGDLEASIAAGESAIRLADDPAFMEPDLLMELRSTLSGTYCETGDLVRAVDLTEPLVTEEPLSPWANVTRLWARAMALQTAGRFDAALDAAREGLLLLRPLGRPAAVARLQNSAAWIAMQLPDFDRTSVAQDLQESAEYFQANGATVELALVLTSQAELATRTGRHDEARGLLHDVLSKVSHQDAGERARITAAAAQLFASMGDRDEANQHLLTARELLENSGAKRSAAAVWTQMAETYASLGQQDLQIVCLRTAMDLLDL